VRDNFFNFTGQCFRLATIHDSANASAAAPKASLLASSDSTTHGCKALPNITFRPYPTATVLDTMLAFSPASTSKRVLVLASPMEDQT